MNVMHNRNSNVMITQESFRRLKKDYAYAKAEGFDAFTFDGHEILVEYAKYMIEYLERVLGG